MDGGTGCASFRQKWMLFLGDLRGLGGPMSDVDRCPESLYGQHNSVTQVLSDFRPTVDGDRLLLQGIGDRGLVYRLDERQ